ncbi:MAG: sulfate adenylyltransferase subunit CysN [Bryobacteraceae bacterium]
MTAVGPSLTIEEFLARHESTELLRFTTAGSVDDGKSTLIGRLLYDSKSVYEDQMQSVANSRINRSSGAIDFSLLTDGLRAEREQGITIDVAYRYFSTPRRKFIIADTPGHEQYTRNMATGASTAHLAIILIDARKGMLQQSRRHTFISSLLGIPNLAVAVNKMDLVDFSREVFENISTDFRAFAETLGFQAVQIIPISALDGDNVVSKSARTPWYDGPALLEHLETTPIAAVQNFDDFRFPVQTVIRPDLNFRGFAGQVASGLLRPGDAVMSLPSGRTSHVRAITSFDGDLEVAFPPQSVCVTLEDEIDVSRGDMLVHPDRLPHISRRFDAAVVWMNQQPLAVGRPYLLKHTTQQVSAVVTALRNRVDVNTLGREAAAGLELNEIGEVAIETTRPLFFDAYRRNRTTGAFILIDPLSNLTVAAGMIAEPAAGERGRVEFSTGRVSPFERSARNGHKAATVWLTARADLAWLLERRLYDRGCQVSALADELESHMLPTVARVLNGAGAIAVCSSLDRAPDGAIAFPPDALPSGDLDAVEVILSELERRGVFLAADVSMADGI